MGAGLESFFKKFWTCWAFVARLRATNARFVCMGEKEVEDGKQERGNNTAAEDPSGEDPSGGCDQAAGGAGLLKGQ